MRFSVRADGIRVLWLGLTAQQCNHATAANHSDTCESWWWMCLPLKALVLRCSAVRSMLMTLVAWCGLSRRIGRCFDSQENGHETDACASPIGKCVLEVDGPKTRIHFTRELHTSNPLQGMLTGCHLHRKPRSHGRLATNGGGARPVQIQDCAPRSLGYQGQYPPNVGNSQGRQTPA